VLAKLTSKNQLTLPKAIVQEFQNTEYFDVRNENGRIVLTPVRIQDMNAIWRKLDALGINEKDVASAVKRARKGVK
jgi:hypothetical protein